MNELPEDSRDDIAPRIGYLIAGYIRRSLTPAEHDELDAWVAASDRNMQLFEQLTDEKNVAKSLRFAEQVNTGARLQELKKQIRFTRPAKKNVIYHLWPYGVAAVLILLAITFYFMKQERGNQSFAQKEILPAKTTAVLILSNGSAINLASLANGLVTAEQGTPINKTGDQLQYSSTIGDETLFNTLSTSIGGQYQLLLPDGSRVWLNAQSSLKFPLSFSQQERVVELTGEAYFEIAKMLRSLLKW